MNDADGHAELRVEAGPGNAELTEALRLFQLIRDPSVALSIDYLHGILHGGEGRLITARHGPLLIGAAALVRDRGQESHLRLLQTAPARRHLAESYRSVDLIAVDPRFRGRGIATGLLLRAEQEAKLQGATVVTAIVQADSVATRSFFARSGYDVLDAGEPLAVRPQDGPEVGMPIEVSHCWCSKVLGS